jgi:hypothetical protein
MADGPSRKRPLDVQASVWVLMRSVEVPTCAEWGAAPHLQTALSGVFASKEAADEACAKHQKALATFCKKQSADLEDGDKLQALEKKSRLQLEHEGETGHFSSQLAVVEMPLLTTSPTTDPVYKLDVNKEGPRLHVVLEGGPSEGNFTGPHAGFDGYDTQVKPLSYCSVRAKDEGKDGEEDEEDEEEDGEDGED